MDSVKLRAERISYITFDFMAWYFHNSDTSM